LNFENIKGIQLYFPSLNEQNRIADLFSMINIRIQTQNKIIAQLESLMQGLREKLFKKQIRFKDENGNNFPDWEMKSLGNILTIGNGKDYKNLNSGDVPVFGTGGLMTYVDSFLYNGETVCIGRKGTINKPMYYKGKIWTVDTLFYTHSFLNCSPKFIYYIFQSINWLEFNEASGVPSLSKNTIERILLSLPSFPEQIRIANFLTSIDEKIEAEKKILNKYENQKEYLLQNIFI
jgi:type I restriction enzyme S subunit